ncbi:MAG: hypothetical protein MZW92_62650 [Comamonadaceae bacterium]|nr:hypothetical protein [Comamonadaceae bacterium]
MRLLRLAEGRRLSRRRRRLSQRNEDCTRWMWRDRAGPGFGRLALPALQGSPRARDRSGGPRPPGGRLAPCPPARLRRASSLTSATRPPDVRGAHDGGARPVRALAVPEFATWRASSGAGAGRRGVSRSEVKEEATAAGRRRGT